MSPRNPDRRPCGKRFVATLLALLVSAGVVSATPAAAQDRTAAWLEAQGLDELLARHLETALEEAREQ